MKQNIPLAVIALCAALAGGVVLSYQHSVERTMDVRGYGDTMSAEHERLHPESFDDRDKEKAASGATERRHTTDRQSTSSGTDEESMNADEKTGSDVLIHHIEPRQGPPGTEVVITGSGFTEENDIHFAEGGTPNVPAENSQKLIFTIPGGVSPCDMVEEGPRCLAPVTQLEPGSYELFIENENGESNAVTFTLTEG